MLLILRSQSTGSDAIKFEYHGFGTRYRDPAKDFPLLRGFAIYAVPMTYVAAIV